MSEIATARNETPVFFGVGSEELFGILTEPTTEPKGLCALHLAGKGPSIATVSRGRMSVMLARRLAAHGCHSLRIEYQGTGDSTGRERPWSIVRIDTTDARGALGWVKQNLDEPVIPIGTCGGARLALEIARHYDAVAGVVLLLPPLRDSEPWRRYDSLPARHMLKRLLKRKHLNALRDKGRRRMYYERARTDVLSKLRGKSNGRPGGNGLGTGAVAADGSVKGDTTDESHPGDEKYRWIGPGALRGLEELIERKIPIVMFFGDEDNDYGDWLEAVQGPVAPLLDTAGDLIHVEVVEGRYYDRPSPEMSARIEQAIDEHILGSTKAAP